MAPIPYHSLDPTEDESRHPAVTSKERIFCVTEKEKEKDKLKKDNVMPTQAAKKSLLQSRKYICHTNNQVVAPLFKTPPTDYATLYSVLSLTQEISAVWLGPE